MPRGTQLLNLVEMFRAEVRQSTQLSVGTDSLAHVKQILRRTQALLYEQYDWSFLRMFSSRALAAGDRYYNLPVNVNLDRIEKIQVKYNGSFNPVDRGIDFAEYIILDSEEDERQSPVRKWDVRWTGSSTQIEVWPIPSDNNAALWFKSLRPLRPLVDDADVADLDDNLIVLFAAAEELEAQKAKDAASKRAAATSHLEKVRGNSQAGSSTVQMGLGGGSGRAYHGTIRAPGT